MTEFVVVAGLSGAGRSTAANSFEDLGWYVIDNLPASLIPQVADLVRRSEGVATDRVCFVLGRSVMGDDAVQAVQALKNGGDPVTVVFLDAPDDVLVRRFEDGRRRHPLSAGEQNLAVLESIAAERELLEPLRVLADLELNTGDLNVHQLRDRLTEQVARRTRQAGDLTLTVVSFGFKHGLPLDADMVLDVRFLPNPHWVPELRPLTGIDPAVRDHVLGHPLTQAFLERVEHLTELILPAYVAEGKAYLTLAIGCTGGRHRSVALTEELARRIRETGFQPVVVHRDRTR